MFMTMGIRMGLPRVWRRGLGLGCLGLLRLGR
jgi:hypothetical protein